SVITTFCYIIFTFFSLSLRPSSVLHVLLVFLPAFLFSFQEPPAAAIYTLSLHDALPISASTAIRCHSAGVRDDGFSMSSTWRSRSEEHTSELQSRFDLVCRLLLEKKKKIIPRIHEDETQHSLEDMMAG